MKIDQDDFRIVLAQQTFHEQKRIIRSEAHIAAANQIHDGDGTNLGIILPDAPAGIERGVVRRAQDIRVLFQCMCDFSAMIAVIAERDHVCSGVKERFCLMRQNPDRCGVFSVDDAEIHMMRQTQLPKLLFHEPQAGIPADVAHS